MDLLLREPLRAHAEYEKLAALEGGSDTGEPFSQVAMHKRTGEFVVIKVRGGPDA